MEKVVGEYFDSCPTEISVSQLVQILFLKINKGVTISWSASVKKITDTLYLTKSHERDIYDFYECFYKNIIVNFRITPTETSWSIYCSHNDTWIFEIGIEGRGKEICIFLFNYGYESIIYKSFFGSTIERLQKIDEIKAILGVEQLDEENREYHFTRFAEKYPIILPNIIPGFEQNIGNIFTVKDEHLVGIQELPIEIEYV